MPQTREFTIVSEHDGLELSVMTVIPDGEVRGLVQFAHGMAEHKMRYLPVMTELAQRGYACIINDHRGHGKSVRDGNDLGYFYADGGRGLVRDLHQITRSFRDAYPGKRLVLIGHSMGSLAARDYAAHFGHEIDGLILIGSPGLNSAANVGLILTDVLTLLHRSRRAHSRLMDLLLNGPFAKRFIKDGSFAWISANRENVAAYEADPLCGFGFTLNGYRALLKMMLAAYDTHAAIRRQLPVHFMSGEDDPCAPNRAGFEFAMQNLRQRGCECVTGEMYPHLRHELLNESSPQVMDDLYAKIREMIGA